MGISLKDIFKNDEERLLENRRKNALRNMIIFCCVIVVLIVFAVVLRFWGDMDEDRRVAITKDIQNIRTAILARAETQISDDGSKYPGVSLEEKGAILTVNGVTEEYRYGYYLLDPNALKEIAVSLNLPDESYVVNYETGDVVNTAGVRYNKRVYHSIDDLLAIEAGQTPLSDKVVVISKASDFNKIRQVPNGYYKLSANIDMSEFSNGEGWEPIPNFTGILDGRGYTISNLTIDRPTKANVALFGEVSSTAKITNLTLSNVNVIGGQYTGALAGYCSGAISYVHVTSGNVTGYSSSTGGLVGAFGIEKISNCTVNANVDGDKAVGGVIGTLYSGTVNRVMFDGNVTSIDIGGGLIGLVRVSSNSTYIQESVARAAVNGKSNLGGFVGQIEMTASKNIDISNSYAKGSIETGENNLGGMIGYIYTAQGTPNINFEHLYADVSVVVKGETSGGFIGNASVGNSAGKVVDNCYWKKDLAPGETLNGTGYFIRGSEMIAEDKMPLEMTMMSNFVSWDFETIWNIVERVDTPTLKWEKNYAQEVEDEK